MKSVVSLQNDAVCKLTELVSDAFVQVEREIDLALSRGWRLPQGVVIQLFQNMPPHGSDSAVWIDELFQMFSEEIIFPEEWRILEKLTLFGDLLSHRRDAEGWLIEY